jgi:hypothetical protein
VAAEQVALMSCRAPIRRPIGGKMLHECALDLTHALNKNLLIALMISLLSWMRYINDSLPFIGLYFTINNVITTKIVLYMIVFFFLL